MRHGPDADIDESDVSSFRQVAYSTSLVPLDHVAEKSDTPASKAITVRLEAASVRDS